MTTLDRRDFVSRSALAAGSWLVLPPWLASGFGLQEPKTSSQDVRRPSPREQLAAAARRARDEGKPLLVLGVPEDEGDRRNHGAWFATWIEHSWPEHVLTLARCVLTCARGTDVAQLTDSVAPTDHPLMWLIDARGHAEPSSAPLPLRTIRLSLRSWREWLDAAPDGSRLTEAVLRRAELDRMSSALREAFPLFGDHPDALANLACSKLDSSMRASIAEWLASGPAPEDSLLVRATAEVLRLAAALPEAERGARLQALATAIRRELGGQRITGSAWARPGLCGYFLENAETTEERAIGARLCGSASYSLDTRRFLYFFARTEERR